MQRLVSALKRGGFGSDAEAVGEDEVSRDNPVMAAVYAAAVQGRIAMGADAGQRVVRLGNVALAVDSVDSGSPRCATLGGFSLHAGVAIGASDRAGLERVCRYMGRPPLACDRLERLSDGRILYRLRHRWRDGTSALIFEPREFMARLAAQIPPPRAHQVRYMACLRRAPRGSPMWFRLPATSKLTEVTPWGPLVSTTGRTQAVRNASRGATCCAACSRWMLFAAIDAGRRCG